MVSKKALGPISKPFPMPVLLLAVRTGEGTAKLMTVVWAGIVGSGPVMLAVRIGGFHRSAKFIDREMNFTLNVPSSGQVTGVDYCAVVSGSEDPDKIGTCGWSLLPSTHISSPMIAECPVNLECRVVSRMPIGRGAIYLAEVVKVHVDEHLVSGSKTINAAALDPLVYAPDGCYYRLGEKLGREREVGTVLKK